MKTGPKLLLSAIALLAAIWALFALTGGGDETVPTTADITPPGTSQQDPAEAAPPRVAAGPSRDGTDEPGQRTEVLPDDARDRGSQGFRGRIVDHGGTPVEGAEIYLIANQANDVFSAMLLAQKGVVVPPVAKDVSGPNGLFELRLRSASAPAFEIRVVSSRHADAIVPNLTLFAGRIIDVGDVRLPQGLTLLGRVAVFGGSDFPVPGAVINVRPAGLLPSPSPTPGREDGIETRTDSTGTFRIDNLAPGFVIVAAVAPGFARVERQNVEIRSDIENRVEFDLPKGLSISGRVTDRAGQPIAGARVAARLIDARQPSQSTARSDADGRFEVLGLVDGPYTLAAVAPGHVREEIKPVRAGTTDAILELSEQGSVWLHVTDPRGRELQRYDLLLRSYHAAYETLGNVLTAQVEPIVPTDVEDGWYRLRDIDPGTYVVQLDAAGWARTFSAPFTSEIDGEDPRVEVIMAIGGTLQGRVVTTDGRPIGDVVVSTLPAFLDDSPFAGVVAGMIPTRLTRASSRTGPDGRFEIPRLAEGNYLVRFEREEFATTYAQDVDLTDGAHSALDDVRMARGAEVFGTVMVDGAPGGQVKISITSLPDAAIPGAPTFHATAVSDDHGRFSLSRRVPPGRYQAQAARQTLPNPILQVIDYQKTRQGFVITSGQSTEQLHFTLTSD